ncbi:hypothetical protein ACRAWD_08170 [Caulobacter segnis]
MAAAGRPTAGAGPALLLIGLDPAGGDRRHRAGRRPRQRPHLDVGSAQARKTALATGPGGFVAGLLAGGPGDPGLAGPAPFFTAGHRRAVGRAGAERLSADQGPGSDLAGDRAGSRLAGGV